MIKMSYKFLQFGFSNFVDLPNELSIRNRQGESSAGFYQRLGTRWLYRRRDHTSLTGFQCQVFSFRISVTRDFMLLASDDRISTKLSLIFENSSPKLFSIVSFNKSYLSSMLDIFNFQRVELLQLYIVFNKTISPFHF